MGPVSEQDQALKPGSPTRPHPKCQAPRNFGCGTSWPALPISARSVNHVLPAGVLKVSERFFQKAKLFVEPSDGAGSSRSNLCS
jgi:hypothetical protein